MSKETAPCADPEYQTNCHKAFIKRGGRLPCSLFLLNECPVRQAIDNGTSFEIAMHVNCVNSVGAVIDPQQNKYLDGLPEALNKAFHFTVTGENAAESNERRQSLRIEDEANSKYL